MAVITMGLTPESDRALRGLVANVRRFPSALQASADSKVLVLAETLKENVKKQFVAGTDKHGVSHNKTGWTLGTFHVEPAALGSAFVVGEGAALLVQEGSRSHSIDAKPGKFLMFESPEYGFVKTKHVKHPGYKGDDYAGRAIAETDLSGFAAAVVGEAYASVFLRSAGKL